MAFEKAAELGNRVIVRRKEIAARRHTDDNRRMGTVSVYVRWCGPFPKGMLVEDVHYAQKYGRAFIGKRSLEYGPRRGYTVVYKNRRYPCTEPDRWKGVDLLLEDGS